MKAENPKAMQQERSGIVAFLKLWIFHILVVILGVALFVLDHQHEGYIAVLILLVTVAWIIRSLFSRSEEP